MPHRIDLHAAEVRYDRDCLSQFFTNQCLQPHKQNMPTTSDMTRKALLHIVYVKLDNKNHIWNALELFQQYRNISGQMTHKDDLTHHKLGVTGSDPVPVEINHGMVIRRQDMVTTQEEGDT